ncbi:MAG: 5'-nucleotidase C-terminal domain-containing protein [Candidatus Gastranaerophilales bacterium]|nr:5'-nucleotidase C-terminal domain-containing protein [Candidatus Gastranaerophilales bacterium]
MNILSAKFGNNPTDINNKITPPNVNDNKTTKTSIFYINDVHGQIPKMQRLISASEHAGYIAKQNNSDILKLSSGDLFIGGDDKRDKVGVEFLNLAGIQAEALGNHEFDITASKCEELLKNSKTSILGMNLNFPDKNTPLANTVLRSTVINGQNGEKYGVIGVQPSDMSTRLKDKSVLEGITIDDKEQTIKELDEEVKKLQNQGLNKIILLSHEGNAIEKEIAQRVSGIDVILGGHSHELIEGIKEGENLLYSKTGEPIIITQAGRDGNHFGVLNLEFDDAGVIKYAQNNVMDTNIYSPNLMMTKTVDAVLGQSPQIGNLKHVDPIPKNALTEENPWADFVADALRNNLDADIVLVNSANFRGSVDYGPVTERDISSIFPFCNKLAKVKINEKDLVDALKLCGKSLSSKNYKPGILQVSGLSYTLDSQGNLTELIYTDKQNQQHAIDVNNPDSTKYYTAVYDEFLLKGGDNLEMLKREPDDVIENYDFDKDKVTIDYIKTLNQPFEVHKDNRIKILQ